jgi:hypothetical protein
LTAGKKTAAFACLGHHLHGFIDRAGAMVIEL